MCVCECVCMCTCAYVSVLDSKALLTLGACARVTVLALSFVRSFIRSVHRAAETIAHF